MIARFDLDLPTSFSRTRVTEDTKAKLHQDNPWPILTTEVAACLASNEQPRKFRYWRDVPMMDQLRYIELAEFLILNIGRYFREEGSL